MLKLILSMIAPPRRENKKIVNIFSSEKTIWHYESNGIHKISNSFVDPANFEQEFNIILVDQYNQGITLNHILHNNSIIFYLS